MTNTERSSSYGDPGHARTVGVVGTVDAVARPSPEGTGLEIRDPTVRYGGFVAVDSLSIHAPFGRITGLLGPNGASKTTTFNACSGLARPSKGAVVYDGRDVSRLSQPARARRGLGRTFQRVELWNSLTVEENIALGREGSMAGASLGRQLLAVPGEPPRIVFAAAQALQLTGTTDIARRLVTDLSTGEKRRVQLDGVLAGPRPSPPRRTQLRSRHRRDRAVSAHC
jgi:ABC-type branched-subunit amino acid transport system ATPase component